jgi:uncharacterized protein YgbK (DUF1537 family)
VTEAAPRIAFYGDDFTGSTDAMECLTAAGMRTILFVDMPSAETLTRFGNLDAVGLAGNSRTFTPEEMDTAMPPVFAALAGTGAPILHYKTCSTFDSSPGIGSIGRVMDLARTSLGANPIPVVAGAPKLGRYSAFGTLFARHNVDGVIHRLDRHPTMSVHPVTPMHEADLRRHFAAQTDQRMALLSAVQIAASATNAQQGWEAAMAEAPDAVLIDLFTEADEAPIGALLDTLARARGQMFVVGSSGVEYALAAAWRQAGTVPAEPPAMTAGPVDRLLVISGSCSPATGAQIATALQAGFIGIAVDPVALTREPPDGPHAADLISRVKTAAAAGRSILLHSSTGPGDPRESQLVGHFRLSGLSAAAARIQSGRALTDRLANLLADLLERQSFRRFVIAGGDTSSAAVRRLGIDALEMVAPLAPGAPICRALAPGRALDGSEMVLKGGQIGGPAFFLHARDGRP